MRIPSGDLAPPRRRRRRLPRRSRPLAGYGAVAGTRGSYAAPRRSRALPLLLAAVLVAAAVGGSLWLRRVDAGTADAVAGPCPAPSAPPSPVPPPGPATAAPVLRLPPPGAVELLLLNGTGRDGLARTVGDALAGRGFRVVGTGNAPQPVAGATRVVFGPGGRPAATLLAAHLSGAELVPAPPAPPGSVQVQLGPGAAVVPAGQVAAAVARLTAPRPVPPAAPSAVPGPACP